MTFARLTLRGTVLGVGLGAAFAASNGPAIGIALGAAFAVLFSQNKTGRC